MIRFMLAALLALVPGLAAAATPKIVEIAGGTYQVSVPEAWDGATALPMAFYLHGYRGSAAAVMANTGLRARFDEAGILLVVPDGAGNSWSHQGSPSRNRDDVAFLEAVREDVAARYPVEPRLSWATGFSQGSSMVWDLACSRPESFAAFVGFSGAFWDPAPERCVAPVNLLHVHGFSDPVVPLEGRAIRETFHQGDVFAGLAKLRELDGCRTNPTDFSTVGDLQCRSWNQCTSGKGLEFCMHPGGHMLPEGWFDLAWGWVKAHAGEGA